MGKRYNTCFLKLKGNKCSPCHSWIK